MNDPIQSGSIVTIVGASTAAIAALAAAMQAWLANRKADRIEESQREALEGQEKIHVLVNSRLTEALEKIATLESRIVKLTGAPADAEAARSSAIEARSKKHKPEDRGE